MRGKRKEEGKENERKGERSGESERGSWRYMARPLMARAKLSFGRLGREGRREWRL